MNIHPSAIVGPQVELGTDVEIGPFAVIEGRVSIGRGTRIGSHVSVGSSFGTVEIGEDNCIYSGAVVGGPPQDLKYKNENTKLIVGNKNIIREYVTLNLGTVTGGGLTQIGDSCLLMAYVHVAHDCLFGNNVVVANATQFAGHVTCEDYARIGGICAIAQFVRVGKMSFVGGDSAVNKDVLPYTLASGRYAKTRGTNKVGLSRAGFPKTEIDNINRAIRYLIMGDRTVENAISEIEKSCEPSDHISHLVQFIKTSKQGIAR